MNDTPNSSSRTPRSCVIVKADLQSTGVEAERHRMALTLAEYFRTCGYSSVAVTVPGSKAQPAPISGSIRDHRPDVSALQPTQDKKPVIVDAVPVEEVDSTETDSRWTLFSSACEPYRCHFNIVCSASVAEAVRKRLRKLSLKDPSGREHYVWGL